MYINSCAERLFEGSSLMREQEIMRRIIAMISDGKIIADKNAKYIIYRLSAVIRDDKVVTQPVIFNSNPALLLAATSEFPKGKV